MCFPLIRYMIVLCDMKYLHGKIFMGKVEH